MMTDQWMHHCVHLCQIAIWQFIILATYMRVLVTIVACIAVWQIVCQLFQAGS